MMVEQALAVQVEQVALAIQVVEQAEEPVTMVGQAQAVAVVVHRL
jgi:hypothetical protein